MAQAHKRREFNFQNLLNFQPFQALNFEKKTAHYLLWGAGAIGSIWGFSLLEADTHISKQISNLEKSPQTINKELPEFFKNTENYCLWYELHTEKKGDSYYPSKKGIKSLKKQQKTGHCQSRPNKGDLTVKEADQKTIDWVQQFCNLIEEPEHKWRDQLGRNRKNIGKYAECLKFIREFKNLWGQNNSQ